MEKDLKVSFYLKKNETVTDGEHIRHYTLSFVVVK